MTTGGRTEYPRIMYPPDSFSVSLTTGYGGHIVEQVK